MNKPVSTTPSALVDAFREYRGRLYQYLRRRLANEDDAQELAQEAFLRLLRVPRADLIANPQAYLYRIGRNLVYEQACKALPSERWAEDSELDEIADPRETTEEQAERTRMNELLELALAQLPARNRAIVLLSCREGLSQREIAEQVGLSKSMVQKCLAQGLAQCRKRLRVLSERSDAAKRSRA